MPKAARTQSARPAPPTLPRKRKLPPSEAPKVARPALRSTRSAPNLKPDAVDILDVDGYVLSADARALLERICDAELASMF